MSASAMAKDAAESRSVGDGALGTSYVVAYTNL